MTTTTSTAGSGAPDPHAAATILDGMDNTIAEDFVEVTPEQRAWLEEPGVQEYNRVTNEMLMEQGRHPDAEYARAEAMAHDVEAELERSSQRATNRFGAALAGAVAVGEWMQQALDYFENDAALQAAADCHNNPTNPLAQSAQRSDPNYGRAGEQIQEARNDNNWDTGVRVLNTANGAASSAIPGAPGMALGVMSGGSNAQLRQLQQQRTQAAVAGVTPCDPEPSASSGGGSGSTTKSGTTGGTTGGTGPATTGGGPTAGGAPGAPTATSTGTPRVITVTPTPTGTPRPNTVRIRVDYLNSQDANEHTIHYSAAADLSNLVDLTVGGETVLEYPDIQFKGEGTGAYNEHGTAINPSYGGVCTVARTGQVTMKVVVQVDGRQVNVAVQGPVDRTESGTIEHCPHNVGGGNVTDVICAFENVDFQPRGGFYRDQVGNDQSGPGWVNRQLCTMEIGPLFWQDGGPVTGPREPQPAGKAAP